MSARYTIISADTHAGGSHEQYREFLDPQYRDDFDAWRGKLAGKIVLTDEKRDLALYCPYRRPTD